MCGVIGVLSAQGSDVFSNVLEGLFQMQHRGQDACGMAISDGTTIRLHKDLGYVRQVFGEPPTGSFSGGSAIGHVRYPTAGSNRIQNAQPHMMTDLGGPRFALASNGDVTNYREVRAELEQAGVAFRGNNDAELLLNFVAFSVTRRGLAPLEAIRAMQSRIQGAYSCVLLTKTSLFAIRDPHGFRPLCFGGGDGFWVVASETNALDTNFVDLVDDVQPGEVVEFEAQGMTRHAHPSLNEARGGREQAAHCVFEYVYFSRPDSIAFGQRVYDVRKRIGARLADENEVEADVVVPVPDSAIGAAMGFAQRAELPLEFGLIRNHYVGRTFISPDQVRRDESVRQKFNPIRSVLKDKRVILVDDSIVRGTTLRKLVRMVRSQGAREVHVRIGSPVTKHSCFYGVDTPSEAELIGARLDADGICAHIEADTLQYISIAGLAESVGDRGNFCRACFDGRYPILVTEEKFERGTAG